MTTAREFLRSYRCWAGTSTIASALLVRLAPQVTIIRSFTLTAIALFLLQWLTYGFYSMLIYPHYVSPLRSLPTVTQGNSLLNGQWSRIVAEPSGQPMREWANTIPNNGLVRYMHLFNRERILLTSAKALSDVLVTKSYEFVKPEMIRNGVGRILGFGILFAEGDEHRMQRKHLSPAFAFRHIKELYPQFWAKSQEMMAALDADLRKETPTGAPVREIGEWINRAALDIIGVSGLGQDFNAIQDPNSELSLVYRKITRPTRSAQMLGLLQFFVPRFIVQNLPIKRNDDIRHAVKIIRRTAHELVNAKRDKLARKEVLHKDIVSVALESGFFTQDQLVNNMMTFLAAGHETTATSFTWLSYLLAQHKDVQTRLREEIRAHLPSLAGPITHETIDGIPLLHAVCQEVLRLYPPVPLTLREATQDTSVADQFVPRGAVVIICPWAVNQSTELWGPDAAEFKPSRWLAPGHANSGGASSNFAFLTFLHGPHSCIGQKFAMAELACLVAAFVGRYEFDLAYPDEVIEIKGGITARPKDGMRLKIKAVEGW